jgi:hypothetical protein
MLPGFGGISASDIPDQIQNGYFCLLGYDYDYDYDYTCSLVVGVWWSCTLFSLFPLN